MAASCRRRPVSRKPIAHCSASSLVAELVVLRLIVDLAHGSHRSGRSVEPPLELVEPIAGMHPAAEIQEPDTRAGKACYCARDQLRGQLPSADAAGIEVVFRGASGDAEERDGLDRVPKARC